MWGGGGLWHQKTNNQNFCLYSVTQNHLSANKPLNVVLSITGIITADTFGILVIHKVFSKAYSTGTVVK